ncbi:MAG: hypothetical protein IKI37_10555 [Oscillospiraceae bacterium]|nr:hypothetical protein [Oscillospiraceae bacterium]
MNHSTKSSKTMTPEGKRFLLTLSLFLLAAVLAGGFSVWHSVKTGSTEQKTLDSETESKTLETEIAAAASIQTESSDTISEPSRQEVPAVVTVTETASEEPSLIPLETPAEIIPVSETAAIPSETTAPTETETILITAETTAPETVNTLPVLETTTEFVSETVAETVLSVQKSAYRFALETILKTHSFQNQSFDLLNDDDIAENQFTIHDIDNDGTEELIIRWSNASSASVIGIIYGCDNEGNVYCKLKTTPYLRFYSNGIIEADAVHNSVLAGANFWPYTLYRYDSSTQTYQTEGYVDAWDKSAFEEDTSEMQNTFPEYADVSHSGMVYFINHSNQETAGEFSAPLDITDYQAWHTSFIGSASELTLPFQKFTEENIAAIQ